MNEKIELIEKEYQGFRKDLDQIKSEFSKQQGIKQSIMDRLEKEFGLKNQKDIDKELNNLIKEQDDILDKLITLKEKIKKHFAKVLED